MLLTPSSVVQHLVERDLLGAGRVVDTWLRVEPAIGRNRVFRVHGAGGGYFVKQPERWHPDELASCEREAAILGMRSGALGAIADLLPTLVDWQPTSRIMVLELLSGCTDLSAYYRVAVPSDVAETLGATTAMLHRGTVVRPGPDGAPGAMADVPHADKPWAFSVSRQASLAGHSGDAYHASIHQRLQREPSTCASLEATATRWRANALIHGDLKWSNWLAKVTSGQLEELFVVDWEMGGVGDTAWDVASMLYSLVYAHAGGGTIGLSTARPSLRAFVKGYFAETGFRAGYAMPFAERCVAYLGARCVQGVYELPATTTRASLAEATLALARSCLGESAQIASMLVEA